MANKHLTTVDQIVDLAARIKSTTDELEGKLAAIEVPDNISAFTNDAKYATEGVVDSKVSAAIAAADHLQRKKVASKEEINPNEDGADKFIYLVPKDGAAGEDNFDEYMVLDKKVEKVGDWKVDLSDYVQQSTLTEQLGAKHFNKAQSLHPFL